MLRQTSSVAPKRGSIPTPFSQSISVMEVLNNFARQRLTSEQIYNKTRLIASNYHEKGSVTQAIDNVNYMRSLASNIMSEYYPSDSRDRVQDEVMGADTTHFSRMKFFYEAGKHGLTLPLSADEASRIARARAIEALLAAAFFGSGEACQLLLVQNELGVIALTEADIQHLVQAQIFWHDKAFGRYDLETNHHDYSNIDEQLKAFQILPELLTNKKAWDAVRQNSAIFADVLRVVYHSGKAIQDLLNADQLGAVVNLTNAERRRLVQNQINQYFAAQRPDATIRVEDQQTPALMIPSKVWVALMETPKESWTSLLQFLKDLDAELPEHFRITNPQGLADWTEENPMAFKAYFESHAAKALISVADLDGKTKNHIETRNRVMMALLGLRHAAFKPDNKALLDMRPAITAKKDANKVADDLATKAIAAEAQEVAQKKEAVRVETAKQVKAIHKAESDDTLTVKVKYDREGWESSFRTSQATDTYARLLGKLDDAVKTNKDVEKYNKRIAGLAGQPDFEAYKTRKAAREARLESLVQEEQASYERLDAEFAAFQETKENEKQARIAELNAMKAHEQALTQALVENNPITTCVRLLFLAAAQDLAMFGTLTNHWLAHLATALEQDLQAIVAGDFAFEFVPAGRMMSAEKSKEKFPLHMLANDRAYVVLINIYRAAPANFRANIQDQLFNFANGSVADVNVVDLLSGLAFPVNSDPKKNTPKSIENALAHYVVEGYADPLSVMFKQIMLLQLFVAITEISPKHDAAHAKFLQDAAILRQRLNMVIVGRAPSRLINYVKMVLLALQDQAVFASLLTADQKHLSQDVSNPFHGVLMHHALQDRYSLISSDDLAEVKLAMKQLANNSVELYTPENVNNRYIVINFFKKLIKLEPRVNVAEAKSSPEDFDRSIAAQLDERQAAGQVTEIDTVLIQFFEDCTFARYTACLAEKFAKFNLDPTAWIHTRAAKVSRGLTAIQGNVRRLSVSSEAFSPLQRQRSDSTISAASSASLSSSIVTAPLPPMKKAAVVEAVEAIEAVEEKQEKKIVADNSVVVESVSSVSVTERASDEEVVSVTTSASSAALTTQPSQSLLTSVKVDVLAAEEQIEEVVSAISSTVISPVQGNETVNASNLPRRKSLFGDSDLSAAASKLKPGVVLESNSSPASGGLMSVVAENMLKRREHTKPEESESDNEWSDDEAPVAARRKSEIPVEVKQAAEPVVATKPSVVPPPPPPPKVLPTSSSSTANASSVQTPPGVKGGKVAALGASLFGATGGPRPPVPAVVQAANEEAVVEPKKPLTGTKASKWTISSDADAERLAAEAAANRPNLSGLLSKK